MPGGPDLFQSGAPGLAARLARFVGDARAGEAAGARSREAFLRRTAADEGTFAGILVDLAERGDAVLVIGAGGRRLRGHLVAVGSDFAALRTADGREALLAHRGITSVTTGDGAPAAAGDRALLLRFGLPEALAVLAEDRPRVLAVTVGAHTGADAGVAGELVAAGRDVLTIRLDGGGRRRAYLPTANLAEVSLA